MADITSGTERRPAPLTTGTYVTEHSPSSSNFLNICTENIKSGPALPQWRLDGAVFNIGSNHVGQLFIRSGPSAELLDG